MKKKKAHHKRKTQMDIHSTKGRELSETERDLRGIIITYCVWTCLDDKWNKSTVRSHPQYNQKILNLAWGSSFVKESFKSLLGMIITLWLYFLKCSYLWEMHTKLFIGFSLNYSNQKKKKKRGDRWNKSDKN